MHMLRKGSRPQKSRRQILEIAAAASLTLAGVTGLVRSLGAPVHAQGTLVPMDELMAKGALPDIAQGKDDAPITMIEYAAVTCTHCAHFHAETYPALLKNYIETGKVRFILREFPLNDGDVAGFMLARCIGPDKRNLMIDLLFDKQKDWAFTKEPLVPLAALVKQTGMSQETVHACITNMALYDQVVQMRERAAEKFGVDATPTFFVNGKKLPPGEMSPAVLDQVLQPMLKKS